VGQCGPYVPIGAEQTSTGYDVAFKAAGADQYVIWSTDSNGNYVSSLTSAVSGSTATLESFETIFHQDLNGDGVIGPVATVIESAGSTSLEQIGNNYYLYTGGSGPSLKSGGVPIVVGQCGPYVPIGAEQTATGYDVAFKAAGADQYVIWSTDNNGNYVSSLTGVVSGSSSTLKSFETIFHQDLNGDGAIGPGMQPASAPAVVSLNNDTFVFGEHPNATPEATRGAEAGADLWLSPYDNQLSFASHGLPEQSPMVLEAAHLNQTAGPHQSNDPIDGHLISLMASHLFYH
jgi:hypothetical protein